MTDDEIYTACTDFVQLRTGLLTIRSHQNGKTPTGHHAVVGMPQVLDELPAQRQTMTQTTEEITVDTVFNYSNAVVYKYIFPVNVYSDDPYTVLRKLKAVVMRSDLSNEISPNVTVKEAGNVLPVPELEGDTYLPRAQMDLVIEAEIKDEIEHGRIDSVPAPEFIKI